MGCGQGTVPSPHRPIALNPLCGVWARDGSFSSQAHSFEPTVWGVGKGRSCRLHYNSRNADPLTYLFQADETSRDYAKNGLHTTFKQADVADVKYRLSNILTNFFSRQVHYFARASIFFLTGRVSSILIC